MLGALQKPLPVAGFMQGNLRESIGRFSCGDQRQVFVKDLQVILTASPAILALHQVGVKFCVLPGRDLAKCRQGTQFLESFTVRIHHTWTW